MTHIEKAWFGTAWDFYQYERKAHVMKSYTEIINDYIDEFVPNPDDARRLAVDTAERFRENYYRIIDVEEDDFDKGVLDDFFEEVREAIRDALEINDLL